MSDQYSSLGSNSALQLALCSACDIPSIEYLRLVDSTQRRARELCAANAREWSVVVADFQTAGRGQHGRRWGAPPGTSVLLSILVAPKTPEALSLIPIRTGLLVRAALGAIIGDRSSTEIKLKWPNDIVANDGKLAGILCEGHSRGDSLRAIIGVGINVRPFEATPGVSAVGASLDTLSNQTIERIDVLRDVVCGLRSSLDLSSSELSHDELERYREHDWLAGRDVTLPIDGTVVGINAQGHLLVRRRSGDVESVISGSVR